LMDVTEWPASGDLGFSLIWTHVHEDGRTTPIVWSENGHEWNTRWYGVLRKQEKPEPLPFRVRVE